LYSSGINVSTGALQIGRDNDTGNTNIFNGMIDEVRIFDYALSSDEIKSLYQNGRVITVQ